MLLKIQNVGKKQKTKKKKFKTTPTPALSPHSPDLFAPVLLVCGSSSALSPGKGRKPGGRVALGTCLWVPTSSPSAGLGGVSGLFMYLLHTHQPMQVPHPGPSMFCALLIPLSSQGFSSPLPLAAGKWDGWATSLGISRVSLLRDPHLSPTGPILFTLSG